MKYAIAFDLDTTALGEALGSSYNNAYSAIRDFLGSRRFQPQQGSVYFGANNVNAVDCVVAIMDLTAQYPWFAHCARDVRMLRVEDDNDLMPVIRRAAGIPDPDLAPAQAPPRSGPRTRQSAPRP